MCEPKIFDRALDYYHNNAIRYISVKDNEIHASVEGSGAEPYKQIIKGSVSGIITSASCTCPYDMGGYCKHIIAVLLALADKKQGDLKGDNGKPEVIDINDVADFLKGKSKKELTEIILKQTEKDDSLLKSLTLNAAFKNKKGINPKDYKQQIQFAFQTGFLVWNKVWDFVQNLEIIKEEIDELIAKKYFKEAKEILEYFIEKAIYKIEDLDDSGGDYSPFVRSLFDSYAKTLRGCNVDTDELGRWVFNSILEDGYGFTDDLLQQMKGPLGNKGFDIVEKMAMEKLDDRFKQISREKIRQPYDYTLSVLKRILTNIAEIQKDNKKHLKILELFLSEGSYSYLEIAEKLASMGCKEEAIKRLEEGIKRFPDNRDFRLNDMLSKLYEKQGDIENAFKQEWKRFKESHDSYKRIKQLAQKIGNWDKVHEDIIQELKKINSRLLIDLYIEDGVIDKAISEVKTNRYGWDSELKTAKAAEDRYTTDSIFFYKRIAGMFIDRKNNDSYREAKKVVYKIKSLYNKLNDTAGWIEYINQVKTFHKAKKNLMKELGRL